MCICLGRVAKTEDLTQGHTLVYTNMKCVVAVHVATGDDVAQNAYYRRAKA